MTQLSNYAENLILDWLLQDRGNVYLAFHSADPTEDATGAEVEGGAYERQVIEFAEAVNGEAVSSNQILFSDLPTITVTHISLWDAFVDGNMLMHADIDDPLIVNSGDEVTIATGAIIASLD